MERETTESQFSRRGFLQIVGAGAMLLGAGGLIDLPKVAANALKTPPRPQGARSMVDVPFEPHDTVRVGIIGLGNRGYGMLGNFLDIPGVQVTALCDIVPAKVERAAKRVTDAGQPRPALYSAGESDWENLCKRDDVDFIYIPTPWEWHAPMAVKAMKEGKHVGLEVPAGLTMDELWELVDTSERTGRHCIQLENCCYGRNEMRVLRMAHEGLFGKLTHAAGAYIHDLRSLLFSKTYYEGQWRRAWHTKLNTDLYPGHGLGPTANYMDINRGDRIVRIVTMGSLAAGLASYRERSMDPDDETWQEKYVKGDLSVSLLQTAKGRLIRLEHNVSSPTPYTRRNHLGGSLGVFEDYPPRIYLEPEMTNHQWGNFDDYAHYDHWLWKENPHPHGGHGGMDYLMLWRLIQTMRLGLVPDMDVYDAAVWSAPVPYGAESIRRGSAPIEIPDFTRGHWDKKRAGVDSVKPDDNIMAYGVGAAS